MAKRIKDATANEKRELALKVSSLQTRLTIDSFKIAKELGLDEMDVFKSIIVTLEAATDDPIFRMLVAPSLMICAEEELKGEQKK